jgi:hypothetical protein
VRSVAPGCDREDALVTLAGIAELTGVHLDSDAGAVDLARAQGDEVERRRRHPGLGRAGAEGDQGLHGRRMDHRRVVDARPHETDLVTSTRNRGSTDIDPARRGDVTR